MDAVADLAADAGPQLLAAAVVAAALILARRWLRSPLTTPIVLGLGVAAAHGVLFGRGLSLEAARGLLALGDGETLERLAASRGPWSILAQQVLTE